MSVRNVSLIALAFTFVIANAYVLSRPAVTVLSDPRNGSSDPGRVDLHGGAVGNRLEIDKLAKKVEPLGMEELVASLGERELTVVGAGLAGYGGGDNNFIRCISDRRVAKLFSLLSEESDSPDADARKVFDYWMTIHTERLLAAKSFYGSRSARALDDGVDRSHYGCCAGLFLMAIFCEPEAVYRSIGQVVAEGDGLLDATRGSITGESAFEYIAKPSDLFQVNIAIHLAERLQVAVQWNDVGVSEGTLRKVPFHHWTAYTRAFDHTSEFRGVPVDDEGVLRVFSVLMAWERAGCNTPECREGILNRLRSYTE